MKGCNEGGWRTKKQEYVHWLTLQSAAACYVPRQNFPGAGQRADCERGEMTTRIARIALATLCGASSFVATAQEKADSVFSLSGFGTLGLVHSSEDQADFGANGFIPKGAGYTREWSPEVDSRLGAQLTGTFTPQLSATLQVVVEQRQDGEYTPRVEWANVKYQLTPQFSIRLGRTALASFLVSDSRKVGYANPWVRPPEEVYSLIPLYSGDGVDASYQLQVGEVSHTLMAGFGRANFKARGGERYKARDQWSFSDTVEYNSATLRVAYQRARVIVDALDPLFDGFRQFGAPGVALADRYDPNGSRIDFFAIGGTYDPGAWFLTAEWGRSNLHSAFGERTSWYTTGGYRFGTFTPYLTYAHTKPNSNRSDPGLPLAGLPPDLATAAAGLNFGLNQVLGSIPVQQSVSVGTRWDFAKNLALKLQYDRLDLGAGSAGVLDNLQPGFVPGGTVHLFSTTVDFVW
jgi:hypothetical protein